MKRLIIGFGHKRGSGKDTCGQFAIDYLRDLGRARQQTWFAQALKEAAMPAFGFTREQVYSDKKGIVDTRWGFTPGWALQKMGTEGFRDVFGFDFWVVRLGFDVLGEPNVDFVICDVRFPNEAAAVKSWGGFVVNVVRPVFDGPDDGRDSNHPSETALDLYADWDGVILNDGSLDDLRNDVEVLVDRFLHVLAMREREEAL